VIFFTKLPITAQKPLAVGVWRRPGQRRTFQLYFPPPDSVALETMFETIVSEIEKAAGKLTHLRRFL
jgi:hypothetical protein